MFISRHFLAVMPREELHQFLICLLSEYIIPFAFHSITSVLRKPEFILITSDKGVNKYLVSHTILKGVWTRLGDRLTRRRRIAQVAATAPAATAPAATAGGSCGGGGRGGSRVQQT